MGGIDRRVLLVEDEMLIALDTEEFLAEAGYTVIGPAMSVGEAQRLAEGETLDAAVLDVNLGGTYVWPLAEQLFARGVPFVLLTGFGSSLVVPPDLQRAPRLGKPFRREALLEVLSSLIARG